MLTHNRLSPPRWRAAYQTCTTCGFQYWQERPDQNMCGLCHTAYGMRSMEERAEALYESAPHLYHVDEIKQFPPFRATDSWVKSSARDSARKQLEAALCRIGAVE